MVSPQQPIDSPFGYRSTAREVVADIDLSGKRVVVTGGYSGIGTETVRALAGAGAEIVVGARRVDQAEDVLSGVDGTIAVLPLDLADPATIDTFAAEVARKWDRLDILVNNAAIMASPLMREERGYEMQFAVNHLGHFQLTARLWPLLAAANGARVVCLSSIGHRLHSLDLDDPNWERRDYAKWPAYGAAKSANALFALELDKRGEAGGVRAFAVHPGGIATPLQRHLTMEEQKAMGWYDDEGNTHESFKSPQEGAATSVWCAVSPLLARMGGVYCEDCNIAEPVSADSKGRSGVLSHVRDEDLAKGLWETSEKLTGATFRP
ncbi:oxidoreductase [Erythrobacter sp.]|jgi:NAD(P)-dependent dehydrogenase (short-subunit alcohol dehydrogenase family)|uniref:oxidoreductase n=1 Tax=Erythrobacter sp. TaxID=1042 RepID=UPI002EB25A39|nr:oxidoreductase [Erythrobacter sp.]